MFKTIEIAFDHEHYQIYNYCVSMIQPLTYNMDLVNSKNQVLLSTKDWVQSHDQILDEF